MNRSRIDAMILHQEGLSRLRREDIEALQLRKLNRLLSSPRIRSAYSGLPARLEALSELSRLPFTTNEDLSERAAAFLAVSQSRVSRVISGATSGTSGASKRVFYTEGDLQHTVELFQAGLGELIFPGSRTLVCMPFSGPNGLGELISKAIEGLGAVPLLAGSFLSYAQFSSLLEKNRPDTFVGFPTNLLSLLRACGRGSLRRALISADSCPASVVMASEAILGSQLFPHYGSREMALGGAVTCPAHEGMHLRENHVIAEIVGPSGAPLPRGEWGELVITTIGMEAMPLLRYRTGDRTRLLPEPCPCGSEVLRLDPDITRLADSRVSMADDIIFQDESVIDCRYEEDRSGRILVYIVHQGALNRNAILTALFPVFPDREIQLRSIPFSPGLTPLYRGKRIIEKSFEVISS